MKGLTYLVKSEISLSGVQRFMSETRPSLVRIRGRYIYEGDPRKTANTCITFLKCVYVYWACVISRSSNDRLRFKEDLFCLTKFSMAAKFIENFIFVWGIGEKMMSKI